jgi:enoyl-CoA hydratase
MNDRVLVHRQGRVIVMTINRPEVRNAVDGVTTRELATALDELDDSAGLSVGVLTGAGGVFSAGMDLKAFLAKEQVSLPGRGLGGLTEAPPRKPLIAAVEGWAVGGGFELVLACDLVIASTTAKFGLPEVKRGLIAGGGGALRLPSRIPRALALEMLLTGEPITAERAAAVGLVNRVVPEGEAASAALGMADSISLNGPLALVAAKEVASRASDWTSDNQWEEQRKIIAPVFASEDAREGAAAFVGKRAAVWTGR